MSDIFDSAKEFIDGVVEVAGEVTKVGVELVGTVAAEAIATPAELLLGDNAISDGVRAANEVLGEITEAAVDHVAEPAARILLKAPVHKAEQIVDIAGGIGEAVGGDTEAGLARAGKAALRLGITVATVGIAGELMDAGTSELLAGGADAGTDAGLAVLDAGGGHAVDVVAGAAASHGATLADAAASEFSHAAAADVGQGVRFSGELVDGIIDRVVNTGAYRQVVQEMSTHLPQDASLALREGIAKVGEGAASMARSTLTLAAEHPQLRTILLRFKGYS